MLGITPGFRVLVGFAAGAMVAGGLLAAPATALSGSTATSGSTASSGSGETDGVTILLKTPDQAGLNRLATRQGLTHAQRVAALAPLLPSAAAHRTVAADLGAAGFTVTGQTAWTITATASSTAMADTFGAPPTIPSDASVNVRLRATSTLPRIPGTLTALVAAALPSSSAAAVFHPLISCGSQCHDGQDFRNAYTAPNVAPDTGSDANGPLTIATLQFAGWNDADLTKYAAAVGLPDPVASGQYTQIPVGQATVPAATVKEAGADEEVDLDQESILSTDPSAHERAYFAPQASASSYVQALSKVVADVTQGTGDVAGGDPKIAALSTSWGACEDEFALAFSDSTIKAVQNILKSLTAAGVTVFAASGDDGIYDCGLGPKSPVDGVDYPASSPQVIGVGGTTLKFVGNSAANTGTNWTDSAWSCTTSANCQNLKAGGSGGGESKLFTMPAYQHAGIGSQPFTTTTRKTGNFDTQPDRLVPDIADDGNPATGFNLLTTDPTDDKACAPPLGVLTCKPTSFAVGGTSLAAPVAASLFTDVLGSHGLRSGIGDIHGALYSAYAANKNDFRDVTSGQHGNQTDLDKDATTKDGDELPVTAQSGYDTLTGLGAPLWPKLAPYLFDTPAPPTVTASIVLATPHSTTEPTAVTATWAAKQAPKAGSTASSADVTIAQVGGAATVYHRAKAPASGSYRFTGKPGADYTITVAEQDLAGQSIAPLNRLVVVPFDDRLLSFHGMWRSVVGASDFGGSHSVTSTPGSFATLTATGRAYVLSLRTGPDDGKLAVFHGATKLGTYDLYSPTAKRISIVFYGSATSPAKQRTFSFRYTGAKNALATGTAVDIDAIDIDG